MARALVVTLVGCAGCSSPTSPSEPAIIVRLGVSPPTIQAVSGPGGWTASWTVNLDAATMVPPDTHGVLLTIQQGPVLLESVEARVTDSNGTLLATVLSDAQQIGRDNGSHVLLPGGALLQVPQQASYAPAAAPTGASTLTITARLRDGAGAAHQIAATSMIHERVRPTQVGSGGLGALDWTGHGD